MSLTMDHMNAQAEAPSKIRAAATTNTISMKGRITVMIKVSI